MDDFDEGNIFNEDNALDFIMSEEDVEKTEEGKSGCLGLLILIPTFIFVAVPSALQYML